MLSTTSLQLFYANIGLFRLLTMGVAEFTLVSLLLVCLFTPLFWCIFFKLSGLKTTRTFKVVRIILLCAPFLFLLFELLPGMGSVGLILFGASLILTLLFFAIFAGFQRICRKINRTFSDPQDFMIRGETVLNLYFITALVFTVVLFTLICIPHNIPFMIGLVGILIYTATFGIVGLVTLIWFFARFIGAKKQQQ